MSRTKTSLVDLGVTPALPGAPDPSGVAVEDQRTFSRQQLAVSQDLLGRGPARRLLLGAQMAGLRRPVGRPVAAALEGIGAARVGRAPPADVLVAQVPQARALQDEQLEELGGQVAPLVAQEGDQPSLAPGGLLPALALQDDAPAARPVRVPAELLRAQEGEDEAEDARLHDQPRALRLLVATGVGGLVGAAPASADDVADVHGRAAAAQERARGAARVPNVDEGGDARDALAPRHVPPGDARRAGVAPALLQGRDVALVPRLLGADAPGQGPAALLALGPLRPPRQRLATALGAEEEPESKEDAVAALAAVAPAPDPEDSGEEVLLTVPGTVGRANSPGKAKWGPK